MLEQLKGTLEFSKLSINSFGAEVTLTTELIDQMLGVIGEVERLKGIEEHAIKRIKAETQENSRWIAFVEHLQNISLCSMTKNEIRQALNTFAERSESK